MKYVAIYAVLGAIYVLQSVIRHPAKTSLENLLACIICLLVWPLMTVLEVRDFWRARHVRASTSASTKGEES